MQEKPVDRPQGRLEGHLEWDNRSSAGQLTGGCSGRRRREKLDTRDRDPASSEPTLSREERTTSQQAALGVMRITTIACRGRTDSREMNGAVRRGSDAETSRGGEGGGEGGNSPEKPSPWRPNSEDVDTAGAGGQGLSGGRRPTRVREDEEGKFRRATARASGRFYSGAGLTCGAGPFGGPRFPEASAPPTK